MGCGSSSQTINVNPKNDNIQSSSQTNVNLQKGNLQNGNFQSNNYYNSNYGYENNLDLALIHTTSLPLDSENEDETPFDDDGFIDNEKYCLNDTGLLIKVVDFRIRFMDDKQEERPYVSPGSLYIDSAFPQKIEKNKFNHSIEWMRPKEFIDHPRLFSNGSAQFEIGQGAAGTCWFISVVSGIARNKKILKQVIPESSYTIEDPVRYDGMFRARLFNFGRWEDVYIDDYLPVIYGKKLWGGRSSSDDSELWVALLEKAFAKKHGSYDAIYGGASEDAYMQMTGGVGERIDLKGMKPKKQAKVLYDRIKNAVNLGFHISTSMKDEYGDYNGLVSDHMYSVINVHEHKDRKTKLIRLHNPWGHGEWKGAWSDGSSEWSTTPRRSAIAPVKDDGKFYMSLSDFMKYFTNISICSLTPDFHCDGRADSLNYVLNIYGEWNGKTAAGFHNLLQNQRFGFTVTENGLVDNNYLPLVVQIVQQSKSGKDANLSIRCDVFKILADKIQPKRRSIALECLSTKTDPYKTALQASFRHKLQPGRYITVASTIDKGQEKAFLLRLFTPAPLENVKEISMNTDLVSCDNENTINVKDKTYALTFEKVLFGEFISGRNAGGQVSNNKTFHLNPQYLITVPEEGSEIPFVVHIMQTQMEPKYAIGIRIFKLDTVTRPPVDEKYLYQHYDESPYNMEGSQYKFMTAWSFSVKYMLQPGRYIALVHLDKQKTEKTFCIAFRSTVHVGIKGFQTG